MKTGKTKIVEETNAAGLQLEKKATSTQIFKCLQYICAIITTGTMTRDACKAQSCEKATLKFT